MWTCSRIRLIGSVLRLPPGEVLINFMTSWIIRFLSDGSKHFERIFGTDLQRLIQLRGEEPEDEIVSSSANAVRAAGHFDYICSLPVMKSTQDAFHFYMIYCTRHVKGVEVFQTNREIHYPIYARDQGESSSAEGVPTVRPIFSSPSPDFRLLVVRLSPC
jgi:hypothetical protein